MGNAFKSQSCDVLLTSKVRLDKAAGRTRRPSPSITSLDVCAMERVAVKLTLKVRGLCAPLPPPPPFPPIGLSLPFSLAPSA